MSKKVYSGDSVSFMIKGVEPVPTPVPYGTNVKGVYFDGYPQLVKDRGSQPTHRVKTEKDIMVAMRDGVRIAAQNYVIAGLAVAAALAALALRGRGARLALIVALLLGGAGLYLYSTSLASVAVVLGLLPAATFHR